MTNPAHPLAELVSLLDAASEPYVVFDRQYRILAANRAYRQRFGMEDIIGRCCYEVSHRYPVPCYQAGESCPLALGLKSGKRERVLHLHHTPRGEEYVDLELTPILNAQQEIVYFVERLATMKQAKGISSAQGLVGRAPAFQKMLELLSRVAPSDAVVLLEGESGTGKELVANALHQASRRSEGPFTPVDCSGIPENLFESELFGHERGAFTGATARKAGLVEAASGGTLFLDEIGEMPLAMQVKLLRLLETGSYRRLGSTEIRRADIRVISATHRSLRDMVRSGDFREDLYYRLNIFPIKVPALRERKSDIPLLVESLLGRVGPGRPLKVSASAMHQLVHGHYQGNIRELRNVLERAALMCDGDEISIKHLPNDVEHTSTLLLDEAPQGKLSDTQISEAMATHRGSRKALARTLDLSERTLYRRLRGLKP